MVAVVGVDAKLMDDLKGVLAPVFDVDERVIQRRAVVAGEAIDGAKRLGGGEGVMRDNLIEQAGELAIGEVDTVERFEFIAEVALKRSAVTNIGTVFVLQILQLADETILDGFFIDRMRRLA